MPQEGTAFFPGNRLAGNGLLVSDGAVWRRQRQLSNPAFRAAAVASYAQVSFFQLCSTHWLRLCLCPHSVCMTAAAA